MTNTVLGSIAINHYGPHRFETYDGQAFRPCLVDGCNVTREGRWSDEPTAEEVRRAAGVRSEATYLDAVEQIPFDDFSLQAPIGIAAFAWQVFDATEHALLDAWYGPGTAAEEEHGLRQADLDWAGRADER